MRNFCHSDTARVHSSKDGVGPTPAEHLPSALDSGIHGVRTPWIQGFMPFRLARRTQIVRLMVLA